VLAIFSVGRMIAPLEYLYFYALWTPDEHWGKHDGRVNSSWYGARWFGFWIIVFLRHQIKNSDMKSDHSSHKRKMSLFTFKVKNVQALRGSELHCGGRQPPRICTRSPSQGISFALRGGASCSPGRWNSRSLGPEDSFIGALDRTLF
jgi:hypothetical protein